MALQTANSKVPVVLASDLCRAQPVLPAAVHMEVKAKRASVRSKSALMQRAAGQTRRLNKVIQVLLDDHLARTPPFCWVFA